MILESKYKDGLWTKYKRHAEKYMTLKIIVLGFRVSKPTHIKLYLKSTPRIKI
jgi:hypothetical protein